MAQTVNTVPHGGLTLGERIAHIRRRRDVSREQAAAIIHCAPRTIGRWERDEHEPKVTELGLLAIALRTSTDYLVGLTDDPDVPDPDSPTRVWLNHAA